MEDLLSIKNLIFMAGIGQVVLVLGSISIPYLLKWEEDVAKLRPLTRQVFWTYAGYIFSTNLSFGILSILGPSWLIDGSPLASAVTIFITLYWAARIIIQFTYFDRTDAPKGLIFSLGEFALVSLFLSLTLIYGYAVFINTSGTTR